MNRNWYLIDSKNKILGRLITKVVFFLMGKYKSNYLPYVDNGDFVILINIKHILISGNKRKDKMYYRHSGYVGNLKSISFENMMINSPKYIIRHCVKGMLPKNKLNKIFMKRLKIYNYYNNLHISQKPILINI